MQRARCRTLDANSGRQAAEMERLQARAERKQMLEVRILASGMRRAQMDDCRERWTGFRETHGADEQSAQAAWCAAEQVAGHRAHVVAAKDQVP